MQLREEKIGDRFTRAGARGRPSAPRSRRRASDGREDAASCGRPLRGTLQAQEPSCAASTEQLLLRCQGFERLNRKTLHPTYQLLESIKKTNLTHNHSAVSTICHLNIIVCQFHTGKRVVSVAISNVQAAVRHEHTHQRNRGTYY